jgi:hypothetical protein
VSSPFTITVEKPSAFKQLGTPNPGTGVIANVPYNVYKVRTRKGVLPLAGQPRRVAMIETKISIPAGADEADSEDIRAMLSAHFGFCYSESAGLGDMTIEGYL